MNNNKNLRIRFIKKDEMRFISHLDLNRTFARAFRRAELPIAYSEGFNPRPKLVFGLNLSIGTESECEILDTQFTNEVSFEEILNLLNNNLPKGLRVYDVYQPIMPIKSIATADYTITVPYSAEILPRIKSAFAVPIMILKQTKSSQAMTDISDNIKSVEFSHDVQNVIIKACLTSGNNDYLNPEYIIKVISENCEKSIFTTNYRIMRNQIYNAEKTAFK